MFFGKANDAPYIDQGIWAQNIVVMQEAHPFTSRKFHTAVPVSELAEIFFIVIVADPQISTFSDKTQSRSFSIFIEFCIIHDDNFPSKRN